MNSGIYKIESIKEPDKFYIGSAEKLNLRKNQHWSLLRLGKHYNNYLRNYCNKHGLESLQFIVIKECTIDNLLIEEQHYIDTLSPVFNGRKIAESNRRHVFSEEVKKNMSKSQQEWRIGRDLSIKLTKEVCDKILELKQQGLKNREISEQLNVSLPSISKVIKPITTYSYKLTIDKIQKIKELINKKEMLLQDIAKEYNVNPSVISNIKAGRLHKNI